VPLRKCWNWRVIIERINVRYQNTTGKVFFSVILSVAKNLNLRDSSSPGLLRMTIPGLFQQPIGLHSDTGVRKDV
jgi:hypothetical protein